ncbi:MAG: sulfatase [Gemmatimonadota bacterium]
MAATPELVENRLPSPLLLAFWLALASGLVEGSWRLFQVGVQHQIILMPLHVIWMAPLADLLWIGFPALVLVGLHRFWPNVVRSGFVIGTLVIIAVMPLVLLVTAMAKIAAVVLAIGLGIQLTRMILAHPTGFRRLVHRTVLPVLAVVILSGASIGIARTLKERRELAALPSAASGSPNVLLIIWDTVRGQNLSVYGYERPTSPFLSTLASEGTRFDRAIATAPWTLPSHGAMFTGQRPRNLVINIMKPIMDTFPTLAGALAAHGYATGGFVANMAFTTREHGLSRDFAHYDDYPLTLGTVIVSSRLGKAIMDQERVRALLGYWNELDRKSAADVNDQFLSWLGQGKDRPFFAFLNYYDAHRPYIAVEPFKSQFVRDSSSRFQPRTSHLNFKDASRDEIRWTEDNYDAALAYQDEQVRLLIEELRSRGMLENTLVIVSSDHGEHFGDHGRLGHMNSLYRQLLQVPLIMRLPGRVPANKVVTTPVSLRDLPRTILSITGIADTGGIPGVPMTRYWNGVPSDRSSAPEPVFSEVGTRFGMGPYSLIDRGYHYIGWQGQIRASQLYHLANDPLENVDLAQHPEGAALMPAFLEMGVHYVGKRAVEKDSTRKAGEDIIAPGQ